MQLSNACRAELEQAEGKVEILLKQNGKFQAEPFEPSAEKSDSNRWFRDSSARSSPRQQETVSYMQIFAHLTANVER